MILVRHGQSEFNRVFTLTRRDPGIVDPALTDDGHCQARRVAAALGAERISRIIASPYTRALQTAVPLAEAFGVPVVINPLVRERYAFACDIGSPRTRLQQDWPQHDFAHIDELWWPSITEPEQSVIDRAARFRGEMASLPDWADTVVVSHWGFILALTGHSAANGEWLRYDPTAAAPALINWHHV